MHFALCVCVHVCERECVCVVPVESEVNRSALDHFNLGYVGVCVSGGGGSQTLETYSRMGFLDLSWTDFKFCLRNPSILLALTHMLKC